MITLTHLELEKVKKEGMEVFTQEQYNRFLEANMEVLQKGESNTLDELEKAEYEELKEEIKSFAQALVYSPSKESEFRIEKSICYIRPKQVEWDESELIKGEDGTEIEKARGGTYTDTPLNRKMGRVGQKYGSKKEEESSNKHESSIGKTEKDVFKEYDNGDKDFASISRKTGFTSGQVRQILTKRDPSVMYPEKKEDQSQPSYHKTGDTTEHNGKKYKKQANGKWLEVSNEGMTSQEHSFKATRLMEQSEKSTDKGISTKESIKYNEEGQRHASIAGKLSDKEVELGKK